MFHNARNVALYGGEYLNVEGNYIENQEILKEKALKRLFESIAPDAFHNSADRRDPPRCHPRTRDAVIRDILEWARNPSNFKLLMWIYGPAGAGKSAIMQTISELLEKEDILGASFFFFRSADKRNNSKHLVATIAYQLTLMVPDIGNHIAAAIRRDPAIFSRNIESQMKALIIDPMHAITAQNAGSSQIYLILLDGLDECSPEESPQEIVTALSKSASESSSFRFLIASRPEYSIRNIFSLPSLVEQTQTLVLDNMYHPDKDIRAFLHDKFQDIKARHPLSWALPDTWPSEEDLDKLVWNASGQFIYAATVIRFIESPRYSPIARLHTVLQDKFSPERSETPFAQLDALYHQIFSSVADITKVLAILKCILHLSSSCEYLRRIEIILGFYPGEARVIICDMHSLLHIDDEEVNTEGVGDGNVRLYHASLTDFLSDSSRSKALHIDPTRAYEDLAICMIRAYDALMPADAPFEYSTFWESFPNILSRSYLTEDLASALSSFDIYKNHIVSYFDIDPLDDCLPFEWVESYFYALDKYYSWLYKAKINPLQPWATRAYDQAVNNLDIWLSNILHRRTWEPGNYLIAVVCASTVSIKEVIKVLNYTRVMNNNVWIPRWQNSEEKSGFISALRDVTCTPSRRTYHVLESSTPSDLVQPLLGFYFVHPPFDSTGLRISRECCGWIDSVQSLLSVADAHLELGNIINGYIYRWESPPVMYLKDIPYCKPAERDYKCSGAQSLALRKSQALVQLKEDLHNLAVAVLAYLQKCGMEPEDLIYNSNHYICFVCQATQAFLDDEKFGQDFTFEG